jgi:hypothetical protein
MAMAERAHHSHLPHLAELRGRRPFELRHLLAASLVIGLLFHLVAPLLGPPTADDAGTARPAELR